MANSDREYELVLLGATGYTGRLTAEHITSSAPTDLKWALAGRSTAKLEIISREIRSINPDRLQPAVEVVELNASELDALAKKTRCIISTVGSYCLHGTPVVEACAKNGTHYFDITGETPWVQAMIQKYHETAKASGAIMIPQLGLESTPSDLLAWLLVSMIREELSTGTREVTVSIHQIKGSLSGGTLASVLSVLDVYSLRELAAANRPFSLSPVRGRDPPKLTNFLGLRNVPDLGTLALWAQAGPDRAIVLRSWGLFAGGSFYGSHFHFHEHQKVRNVLLGILVNIALSLALLLLIMPPVRWILKRLVPAPGSGATREAMKKEMFDFRAIAVADQSLAARPQRAFGRMYFEGGIYQATGIFASEAAMVILRGPDDVFAKRLGGGILTSATLGQPFVDRLTDAGMRFETRLLEA